VKHFSFYLFLIFLSLFSIGILFLLPAVGAKWELPDSDIYWKIRFQRSLLAMIAGGGLAITGLVFQAMFRNPLATPYTLGIASGASFGAAVCLQSCTRLGFNLLSGTFLGFPPVSWGAFAGASLAMLIVFALARAKDSSSEQMLLAGVAVNFFFASMIVLLQYLSAPYDTMQILRWTMGGVQNATPADNFRLVPAVLVTTTLLWFFSRELNVIVTGKNRAQSLGITVDRLRNFLFILTSLLVGIIVAVTGPIGFVGLMIPHITRLIVGPDHRLLIPVTFFFGAVFLVLCDTLGRCLFFPSEMPVGIITSLLGGPFFLWLLLRSEKRL
jgi:iron complex transport system permease protein